MVFPGIRFALDLHAYRKCINKHSEVIMYDGYSRIKRLVLLQRSFLYCLMSQQ
jgi:hypothetical protein